MRRIPWVVLLVSAVACGGSGAPRVATLAGSSATPTASAQSSKDPEQAMLEFTRCLREQGLDVPDPDPNGGGLVMRFDKRDNPEVTEKAHKACEHLLSGVVQRMDPKRQDEMQDAFLAFARCMRGEGVDVPDPDFSGGGVGLQFGGPGSDIDPEDPTFKAAEEKCRGHLPDVKREGGPAGGAVK